MRKHGAVPGEPVEWQETYAYANDLIQDGILERDEVICQFSMFDKSESKAAFDWLVNVASRKHLENFDDESDISTSPFLEKNIKNQEITKELSGYLTNTYLGPRQHKKIGSLALKVTGCTLLACGGLGFLIRISETGEVLSPKITDNLTQAAVIMVGSLLVARSIDMDKD